MIGPQIPQILTAVVRDGHSEGEDILTVPWWSYTKVAISTAALLLADRGTLPLDVAINHHGYSIRHLLQHRSGLPDYGYLAPYQHAVVAGDSPWSVDELWDRSKAETLIFSPGQGWNYSNIGYLLVRQQIERVMGVRLDQALEKLVFSPHNIKGVTLAQTPLDLHSTAWGNAAEYHPNWVYHGLLVGTPTAAALLLHKLLSGEILPVKLLSEMCSPYDLGGPIPNRPWQIAGYGLGLMVGEGFPLNRYVGHTGEGPGSTAAVYGKVDANHRPL